jgi:glycerol-3-phosphate dehydrogenase subunit B
VDANELAFARAFDEPAFRNRVAGELAPKLRSGERVAVPAVLGIANPYTVWSELEKRLARPVFEVPTLPPSVPGMRVFASLREALRRAGGNVRLNNIVVGAEREGDRVSALRVRVGLREERHEADWIVVAHGGVAGGGVALDSAWTVHETALGLPIGGAPEAGEPRFTAGYFDPQPMSAAGVAVDGSLRPAGFENVVVAGASLAGAVPWKEKSGDGLSLATGYAAAAVVLGSSMTATRS